MEFKNIKNRKDLAFFLGIEDKELTYILYAKKPDNLYTTFEIAKKTGGVRIINAPMQPLKKVQESFAIKLYEAMQDEKLAPALSGVSHGFVKERNIITNAANHRNKKYVLNIDIKDFFDSFHFGRVRGYFINNKYFNMPEKVATYVAQLVCYKGKLPQGAPTSPIITNLICSIMDYHLIDLAKKYHLNYTRYADDLTFSTNDPHFIDNLLEFMSEVSSKIDAAGFLLNEKKTRITISDSRQEVTGLIVNKKIAVKREYYKMTRTMAHYLYTGKQMVLNGEDISVNQLEGRFSFINQIDYYNNIHNSNLKSEKNYLSDKFNSREKQYRLFLFYKYFFANEKPLIVTEGKTDSIYIKAALKNLYIQFPELVSMAEDGSFNLGFSFMNRTKYLKYFFGIDPFGADTMKNIYNAYKTKYLYDYLYSLNGNRLPKKPVILLFDNEKNSKKPLQQFLKHIGMKLDFDNTSYHRIKGNLYVLTIPRIKNNDTEIEDLFTECLLKTEINGKTFNRHCENIEKHYGKEILAKYVMNNYSTVDFSGFEPLMKSINDVLSDYESFLSNNT